jgi:U3 small nucleolar RNA-associated protein 14
MLQALQAALPRRIRERQERKAAYEESRKQASKWTPLVKANREAATLRLKSDVEVPRVTTVAGLASKHEAQSAFEMEVAQLLKEAGHANTQAIMEVRTHINTRPVYICRSCGC